MWELFFNMMDFTPKQKTKTIVYTNSRFWRSWVMIEFAKRLGRFSSWLWDKMWNRRYKV